MHILITGGSGFLGARLARTLLAQNTLSLRGDPARKIERITLADRVAPPDDLRAVVGDELPTIPGARDKPGESQQRGLRGLRFPALRGDDGNIPGRAALRARVCLRSRIWKFADQSLIHLHARGQTRITLLARGRRRVDRVVRDPSRRARQRRDGRDLDDDF